jgi:hypothetical protein
MQILKRKGPTGLELAIPGRFLLDRPLLRLSGNAADNWTIGDSFEHTLVVGGTGSGKTSGSGSALASTFLNAGYGGLVLCAKPEEADRWENYARSCGRSASVIRFDGTGRWRFNFLDYLMSLPREMGGGLVDNAVNTFLRVLEASNSNGSSGGQDATADFWTKSVRDLLANAIGSLFHAHGRVRLEELMQLINSVPVSEEQALSPDFQTWSFCYATMKKLFSDPRVPLSEREAKQYVSYFGQAFGRLDPKTRSNIVITLNAEIGAFLREPLHELFCTDTNFVPEVTHEGLIVILDLPVKRFEQTGVVAQLLIKYLWQKATERRTIDANSRPVFLFADEAQLFLSSYDLEFQSTARSARAATVYITQNLPSLYARLGGRNPQDQADAIIGNFQTKIFHSNTDHRTNQWAADLIGRALQNRRSSNWSHGLSAQSSVGRNGGLSVQRGESDGTSWGHSHGSSVSGNSEHVQFSYNMSTNSGGQKGTSRSRTRSGGWSDGESVGTSNSEGGGWSEQMDYVIQPAFFANSLRQGGPRSNFFVSAVLLQANRSFSRTGTCWSPVVFKQQ